MTQKTFSHISNLTTSLVYAVKFYFNLMFFISSVDYVIIFIISLRVLHVNNQCYKMIIIYY